MSKKTAKPKKITKFELKVGGLIILGIYKEEVKIYKTHIKLLDKSDEI